MADAPKLDIAGDNNRQGLIELHHAIDVILTRRGYMSEVNEWYPTLKVQGKEIRWEIIPTVENPKAIVWRLETWTDKANWDGPRVEVYVCVPCGASACIHADKIQSLFPYYKWLWTGMEVEPNRIRECGLS